MCKCLFDHNIYLSHSDALRRHFKSCNVRLSLGYQVPERSQPGKRKIACDCCAERKRACDQGRPCYQCSQHNFECNYDRLKQHTPSESSPDLFTIGGSFSTQSSNEFNREMESGGGNAMMASQVYQGIENHILHRQHFQFLLNFTHANNISDAYNYRIPLANSTRSEICTGPYPIDAGRTESNPNSWDYLLNDGSQGSCLGYDCETNSDLHVSCSSINISNRKMNQVWEVFQPFCDGSSLLSMVTVMLFFSHDNIVNYLGHFWNQWYPHCPIVHRPTFEVDSCPDLLLIAMTLIGACASTHQPDRQMALLFLDAVESLIFSQPLFSEPSEPTSTGKHNKLGTEIKDVNLLQASYILCILQKWEGSDGARIRIQRDRFTRVVAVREKT